MSKPDDRRCSLKRRTWGKSGLHRARVPGNSRWRWL